MNSNLFRAVIRENSERNRSAPCRLEKIPLQLSEISARIFLDRLDQKSESSEALELAHIGMFPSGFLKDLLLFSEMLSIFRQDFPATA